MDDYGLKTRKKAFREKENPIRRSYRRLLRTHDRTRQVFPVNPYAEVYRFRDNLWGIYTESLDGMGDPWIYLIRGPERAMLIDTGFGAGNLRGLVEELIGEMPLIVVNTHAHFDHAYGNCQFEQVYCHEYEVPRMEKIQDPHIWDYLFDESGACIWTDFERKDIIPFRKYKVRGCGDHHVFDLGKGYEIELIHTGGHTPGHAMYLDRNGRLLFAGDDACFGDVGIGGNSDGDPFSEYATVSAMAKAFRVLTARRDAFDGIFPGHGPVDMGADFLNYILEACEKILAAPHEYDAKEESERNGHRIVQYKKMIFQSGYVVYQMPDGLLKWKKR